jgi:hypothetical protein
MEMSESSPPIDCGQTELFPMSFAAGSPARTSAQQAPAQASRAHALAYGARLQGLLATFDHASSSWKMSQLSLVEDLTEFSGTWPRSGSMQSGIAYQLSPLVPITDEIASGLSPIPTPTSRDWKDGTAKACQNVPTNGLLGRWVHIWPTPTAKDTSLTQDLTEIQARREKQKAKGINGNGFGLQLGEAVRLWPTPNARDWQGAPGAGCRARGGRRSSLPGSLKDLEGSGTLNPQWVEWLMGYPSGWTDLSNLETP